MAKTPSAKLYRIVKSLSGSEKRYFKIYLRNRGTKEKKYLQLFSAIEKQEKFDETALQKEIYPNGVTDSRKYSELKSYLYELLLRSLQAYDEQSSKDYKLKNMLLSVRSLYKRSLFADCKDVLYKAKKTAAKYEDFNAGLEILRWEKQIAYAETDIAYLDKELTRITEEEKILVRQIRNISEYRNIFYRLLTEVRKDATTAGKNRDKLSFVKKEKVMRGIENAESFTARVLYYRVLSVYSFSQQNPAEFYTVSKKLLEIFEKKNYMIVEDASEYISALSNHFVACGSLGKYDEVENTLDKLKTIKPNTADDRLKSYRQYYLGKFNLYITSGQFAEAYRELQTHLKTRKNYDEELFKKDTFYIKYFTVCFGAEKYEEALSFLNEWLSMSKNIERKDLQGLARILNLIIHYEMKNYELLHPLLRSAYRFLTENKMLSDFTRKFLTALREATELYSRKGIKKHWEEFAEEHPTTDSAHTVIRWFPLREWIISKAGDKSLAEAVQENFARARN